MTPLDIEDAWVKGQSQQLEKESQAMTFWKMFSHLEPHAAMKREI